VLQCVLQCLFIEQPVTASFWPPPSLAGMCVTPPPHTLPTHPPNPPPSPNPPPHANYYSVVASETLQCCKLSGNIYTRSGVTSSSTHYQAIFSPNFDLEIFKVKGHNPEKLFQQTQVQYFKNVYVKNHQSEINRNVVFRPDKVPTTRQFFPQTLTLKFLRLKVITLKNFSSRHRFNISRMFKQKIINLR